MLTLALAYPTVTFIGMDINEAAVRVAERKRRHLQLPNVVLRCADVLDEKGVFFYTHIYSTAIAGPLFYRKLRDLAATARVLCMFHEMWEGDLSYSAQHTVKLAGSGEARQLCAQQIAQAELGRSRRTQRTPERASQPMSAPRADDSSTTDLELRNMFVSRGFLAYSNACPARRLLQHLPQRTLSSGDLYVAPSKVNGGDAGYGLFAGAGGLPADALILYGGDVQEHSKDVSKKYTVKLGDAFIDGERIAMAFTHLPGADRCSLKEGYEWVQHAGLACMANMATGGDKGNAKIASRRFARPRAHNPLYDYRVYVTTKEVPPNEEILVGRYGSKAPMECSAPEA